MNKSVIYQVCAFIEHISYYLYKFDNFVKGFFEIYLLIVFYDIKFP